MIVFVIGVAIGVLIFWFVDDFSLAFVSTGVFIFLFELLFGLALSIDVQKIEVQESESIVSLSHDDVIDGSMFLGSGSVGEDYYFVYYTETEKGFERRMVEHTDSKPAYVHFTDDDFRCVTTIERSETISTWGNTWWLNLSGIGRNKGDVVGMSEKVLQYDIYIPYGSVDFEYKLN